MEGFLIGVGLSLTGATVYFLRYIRKEIDQLNQAVKLANIRRPHRTLPEGR